MENNSISSFTKKIMKIIHVTTEVLTHNTLKFPLEFSIYNNSLCNRVESPCIKVLRDTSHCKTIIPYILYQLCRKIVHW